MNVFVAGMLRSGSTHIAESLARIMGCRVARPFYSPTASPDEHHADPAVMMPLMINGSWVFHSHTKGTGNNRHYFQQLKLKPVVVVRNLFDSMISVYEQMEASPVMSVPGVPRPAWWSMSATQKWKWLLLFFVPWTLAFRDSWQEHALIVHYEQHFEDQVKSAQQILKYVDPQFTVTDDAVDSCFKHHKGLGRFNVGVSGRGMSIPADVRDRVLEMTR